MNKAANVSTVPKRSPFRYPGGKTWLVPTVRKWLKHHKPGRLVEPFTGGGIVSLTAVDERLVGWSLMYEIDEQVSYVWKACLSSDADALCEKIRTFKVTKESVEKTLAGDSNCTLAEAAFRTILKNRTYHGGIIAPGSRPMKLGEDGKGLTSRWYPETLCKRIEAITANRFQYVFMHGDGFNAIRDQSWDDGAAFFIDPPYTVAGRRLYTHHTVDHEALFCAAAKIRGPVLMTYDNTEEIVALARRYGFQTQAIAMSGTRNKELTELLVSRSFRWDPYREIA